MKRRPLSLLLGIGLAACSGKVVPDAGPSPDAFVEPGDAGPTDSGRGRDAFIPIRDGGLLIVHDAGSPPGCTRTCDCPQGLACLDGVCKTAGVGPVWCCGGSPCPGGEPCLDPSDRPGRCPTPPDAGPDAGPADSGPGPVGAGCDQDTDCDVANGLVCWERSEFPFFWGGYCSLENCSPACPAGSTCIQVENPNGAPRVGCMASCLMDGDCRSDAYCFVVPGTNPALRLCLPDCRDDIFDCSPRDGTRYCSPASGRCENTPTHAASAAVGDPCADARDCGPGQVCMGEAGWGVPGGMCTRVCDGLPEASPCGVGETCQTVAGIGVCFRDCVQGACPARAGAACGTLDPAWPRPSCLPQ